MIMPMETFVPQIIIFCLGFVVLYIATKQKKLKRAEELTFLAAICFCVAIFWFIYILYARHKI